MTVGKPIPEKTATLPRELTRSPELLAPSDRERGLTGSSSVVDLEGLKDLKYGIAVTGLGALTHHDLQAGKISLAVTLFDQPLQQTTFKRFLRSARLFLRNLRGQIAGLASFPLSFGFMGVVSWSLYSGNRTAQMTDRLVTRAQKLADKNIFLSEGLGRLIEDGSITTQLAEMMLLGIAQKIGSTDGAGPTVELIAEVLTSIRSAGMDVEGQLSPQFKMELSMTGKTIDKFFSVTPHEGKLIISVPEEPENPSLPVRQAPSPEVIEAELISGEQTSPEFSGDTGDGGEVLEPDGPSFGRELTVYGGQQQGPGTSLVKGLPSLEELLALRLPARAIHSLAKTAPTMAVAAAGGLIQLRFSTDAKKISDAIRIIRELFAHADPEEKKNMLRQIADIFLTYDKNLDAEEGKDVNRIKREIAAALQEMGISAELIRNLEDFTFGQDRIKPQALQGIVATIFNEGPKSAEEVFFARYISVRMVIAEIRRGSEQALLSASIDCVEALAESVAAEGLVADLVSALITRASATDVKKEESMVYNGLRALLDANRSAAMTAMKKALNPTLFSPADIMLYKLLLPVVTEEDKEELAERMAADYLGVANLDRTLRPKFKEALLLAGEPLIAPIAREFVTQLDANNLTPALREDVVSIVNEIESRRDPGKEPSAGAVAFVRMLAKKAGMARILVTRFKILSARRFPADIKQELFEFAAGWPYDNIRMEKHILEGIRSLDTINGLGILEFLRKKVEDSQSAVEERFYVGQMAAKVATLQRRPPELVLEIDWACEKVMAIFLEQGRYFFEPLLSLISSPAMTSSKIAGIFNEITSSPPTTDIPGRDRAILASMARNTGLSAEFLMNTVGRNLLAIGEALFGPAPTIGSAGKGTHRVEERAFVQREAAVVRPETQSVSVMLPVDPPPSKQMLEKLHGIINAFVSRQAPGKYSFDPRWNELTATGVATERELAELINLVQDLVPQMGETIQKKLGPWVAPIKKSIGDLHRLSVEAGEREGQRVTTTNQKNRTEFIDEQQGGVIDLSSGPDSSLGVDLADKPHLERFEEIIEGLLRLYTNGVLSQSQKDEILGKILDLYDKIMTLVTYNEREAPRRSMWAMTAVRPLTAMFLNRFFNRSQYLGRIIQVLIKAIQSYLDRNSRWKLLKLIIPYLSKFSKAPKTLSALSTTLMDIISKNPEENHDMEKVFLKATVDSFGKNGKIAKGILDPGIEDKIETLLKKGSVN